VQANVDSSEGEASVVPNGPTTSAGEIDHVISPCGCQESNGKQQPFGKSGQISPKMSLPPHQLLNNPLGVVGIVGMF
jgi:hypothetical protein